MEELFTLILPNSQTLNVSWDENGIKQFQEANGLKDIKIRIAAYQKTPLGFCKFLLIRLTKQGIRCTGGRYNHLTHTITLFYDTIPNSLITKDDAESEEKMTMKLRKDLPGALSHTLAHEFGHAKDVRSLSSDLSWKLLIPWLGEKHLRKCKARNEATAEKFAEKHAKELEQFFSVAKES